MQARAFEPGARKPFAQRRDRIRRARRTERIEVFDDDRAPAILQSACDFAERCSWALRGREDSIDGDRVEQRASEWQVVHVATLQLAMTEPGSVNVGARESQSGSLANSLRMIESTALDAARRDSAGS